MINSNKFDNCSTLHRRIRSLPLDILDEHHILDEDIASSKEQIDPVKTIKINDEAELLVGPPGQEDDAIASSKEQIDPVETIKINDEAEYLLVGPPGKQGERGIRGPEGVQGKQGIPGGIGPQGRPGPVGPPGIMGLPGLRGPQGIAGEPGLPGPAGPAGPPGPPGPSGCTGEASESGGPREAQGIPGPRGAQGIPGLRGAQGIPGPRGVQGIPGPRGAQGAPGIQGLPGIQGEQGVMGPPGKQGERGIEGPRGPQGIRGPEGLEGRFGYFFSMFDKYLIYGISVIDEHLKMKKSPEEMKDIFSCFKNIFENEFLKVRYEYVIKGEYLFFNQKEEAIKHKLHQMYLKTVRKFTSHNGFNINSICNFPQLLIKHNPGDTDSVREYFKQYMGYMIEYYKRTGEINTKKQKKCFANTAINLFKKSIYDNLDEGDGVFSEHIEDNTKIMIDSVFGDAILELKNANNITRDSICNTLQHHTIENGEVLEYLESRENNTADGIIGMFHDYELPLSKKEIRKCFKDEVRKILKGYTSENDFFKSPLDSYKREIIDNSTSLAQQQYTKKNGIARFALCNFPNRVLPSYFSRSYPSNSTHQKIYYYEENNNISSKVSGCSHLIQNMSSSSTTDEFTSTLLIVGAVAVGAGYLGSLLHPAVKATIKGVSNCCQKIHSNLTKKEINDPENVCRSFINGD